MALPELMISMFLFGLLSAVLFGVFFQGMRAWRVADTQRDLVEGSRVALTQLDRAIQESSYASLSVGPGAVCLLSALDDQGHFCLGPAGEPVWQRFVLFYRSNTGDLRRSEVAWPASPTPEPIEIWQAPPLTAYLSGGRLLLGHVRSFAASVPSAGRRLDYTWEVEWERGGGLPTIRFTMAGSSRFRNP